MSYVELQHSQLQPDPQNVRRRIVGIPNLAASIAEYGLMQNLVARPGPVNGNYLIVAGERRWHAIALLIEQGVMPADYLIPVMLVDGDGVWENLVENHERKSVPVWELGHRFSELIEAGHTQLEIAGRLRMAQGRVSRLVAIANGLAPETIDYLQKNTSRWTISDLVKMAALRLPPDKGSIDEPGPDVDAQIRMAKSLLGERKGKRIRRPRKKGKREEAVVFKRYQTLRDHVAPKNAEEMRVINAVVAYLSGKSKTLKLDL